uniref:Uncharacterized protein n=1 Tax=Plectus sambesii TaxID=2011161 RepID=A0A914XS54_9BILA
MINARVLLLGLVWLPSTIVAFLCGVGELPVGLSVRPDGQPLLLCQRSQCLIQSHDLGYTQMKCDEHLTNACLRKDAFVLAFGRPETSSKMLSLMCCNHPSLALRDTTTEQEIESNSTIIVGGSIVSSVDKHEIGFNLIKNIVKMIGKNNTITYRVITDRADCKITTNARAPTEDAVRTS